MSFADRTPQSPNEGYLRQIADGDESPFDRDPQSPIEALLKIIATGEGEIPDREPTSANEYWLKQIAEGGGGGGVEMESGTYTPSQTTIQAHIAFKNTHDRPPDVATIQFDMDSGVDPSGTTTLMNATFIYIGDIVKKVRVLDGIGWYGIGVHTSYATAGTGYSQMTGTFQYPRTQTTMANSKNCSLYFMDETEFKPTYVSGTTQRYFQGNAPYKWYAFWLA